MRPYSQALKGWVDEAFSGIEGGSTLSYTIVEKGEFPIQSIHDRFPKVRELAPLLSITFLENLLPIKDENWGGQALSARILPSQPLLLVGNKTDGEYAVSTLSPFLAFALKL